MQKKTNLCHVALWCGQHLGLMEIGASVFACVIFWGGVVGMSWRVYLR